ncbi:MAG: LysR family transcriptional regulator [Clostridiales bacterium]|nr:LysR family transcriptional regulator [Clostridiales bacterium]
MTLQQMLYVISIAEYGSINKASEALYVSQPSLTASLQALEKEVGFTIFTRNGRGVSLTEEGSDLMPYLHKVCDQNRELLEYLGKSKIRKKKFRVTTQHYSFAVKAFVELLKEYDSAEYEFAIVEARTKSVISDVASLRSEIGLLYLSSFNRSAMTKILKNENLEFHHIINCDAYVYLWKGHPLAGRKELTFDDLREYPCLSFEQGDASYFYYAEEILSTEEYKRQVWANDRATMLNLMIGLNGYTLCSGIICEELNGSDYLAIPFVSENPDDCKMEIGYITKKELQLSTIGGEYIAKISDYLGL